jgi:hypothetical protein
MMHLMQARTYLKRRNSVSRKNLLKEDKTKVREKTV